MLQGGPLSDLKILELGGIGPCPFACMLFADLGADVMRISRIGKESGPEGNSGIVNRSRPSVALNLKNESAQELILELCESADALIEGFRPGVTERLGLGPADVHKRNRRLVYGRMTGYGQEGPLSQRAGHDINYIAISGALWPIGRVGGRPIPPLNLVGDFGGGSLYLAFGVISAVLEARVSGEGQVVDAAMVDGSASMMAMTHSFLNSGNWVEERGANLLDTGAHFYEVYETKDRKFVAVGAIEPQFYSELLSGMGLDPVTLPHQMDRSHWPSMKSLFAEVFAGRTRDEWTGVFEETDACVTPVLSPREAALHRYNTERNVFATDAEIQPQPAPRFSRTPGSIQKIAVEDGFGRSECLSRWGVGDGRQSLLHAKGAFA